MIPFSIDIKLDGKRLQNIDRILENLYYLADLTEADVDDMMKKNMKFIRQSISVNYERKRKNIKNEDSYLKLKNYYYQYGKRVYVSDHFGNRMVRHPRAPGLLTEMLWRSLRRIRGESVGIVYDVEEKQEGARAYVKLNKELYRKKSGFNYVTDNRTGINKRIAFMELEETQLSWLSQKFIDDLATKIEQSIQSEQKFFGG